MYDIFSQRFGSAKINLADPNSVDTKSLKKSTKNINCRKSINTPFNQLMPILMKVISDYGNMKTQGNFFLNSNPWFPWSDSISKIIIKIYVRVIFIMEKTVTKKTTLIIEFFKL